MRPLRQAEIVHRRRDAAQAVADAPRQVDARRLGEILRRAAHLGDRVPAPEDLREHLVVEDEVVGVLAQRQRLEQLPRERAVAGVILRQLRADA